MNNKTEIINNHLSKLVQKGELSNEAIVSIIENLGSYLNLKTIADYARVENITYNAVLKRIANKRCELLIVFNQKFIIDNE